MIWQGAKPKFAQITGGETTLDIEI